MTIEKQIELIVNAYEGIYIYDYRACLKELDSVWARHKLMLLNRIIKHNEEVVKKEEARKRNLENLCSQTKNCVDCHPAHDNILALDVTSAIKPSTNLDQQVILFLRRIFARKNDEELDEIYNKLKTSPKFEHLFKSLILELRRQMIECYSFSKKNNITTDEMAMYISEAEDLSAVVNAFLEMYEEDICIRDATLSSSSERSKRLVFLTNENDVPYAKMQIENMSKEMYAYVLSALNDLKQGHFNNCKKVLVTNRLFQKRCVKIRLFFTMEANDVIVIVGVFVKKSERESLDNDFYLKMENQYMQRRAALDFNTQESIGYENDIFTHLNSNMRGVGR